MGLGKYILFIFFLLPVVIFAQKTTIRGKVTDARTGEAIPFANVVIKGVSAGASTNFEGYYEFVTYELSDSIQASYIGYHIRTKAMPAQAETLTINFQLDESVMSLKEVVFVAGENPAYPIMRNVIRNKKNNNRESLSAYQYDNYTKIEVDVDNMSEKFRQKKLIKKITQVMDSVDQIAGDDGKPLLPVFISESVSKFYFRRNPKLQHENILSTKVTGVGLEDGSFTSQFIGSSFQQYNFYKNRIGLVSKDFVSPIADGWKLFYEYDLIDSLDIAGDFCYRLDFYPKSKQDLAFTGSMWITKEGYALKQIDVTVGKEANLNYIEKIKLQQELEKTIDGPWVPAKSRIVLDVGEISENSAGLIAKFYSSNKNIVSNQPKDPKFYEVPILLDEEYRKKLTDEDWNALRHEPLSSTEQSVYAMIDTLKNIPVVKTYTELIKIAVNGYKKLGKVEVGPYLSLYANNNVEGHRFSGGIRTTIGFSDKWILGGRIAYGTNDEEFKYKVSADYIFSRKRWTQAGFEHTKDIDQVGLEEDRLIGNSVFQSAVRFGKLRMPYYFDQSKLYVSRELFKGFTQRITFMNRSFDPAEGFFNFGYYTQPEISDSPIAKSFTTSELIFETRYARDELYVQNDNERVSLGTKKWPVFTVRYTMGMKDVLESDFEYHKLGLNIRKDFNAGLFGQGDISFTAEHTFDALPYPLLKTHIGNESNFYAYRSNNLMNYSEFASDSYMNLKYTHQFEGFFMNRIPLIKKLKLRLVGTANILWGDLSEGSINYIPTMLEDGTPIDQVGSLEQKPYVELGYGFENILKVIRVDFIHRMTHTDKPGTKNFGVKFSFQFVL